MSVKQILLIDDDVEEHDIFANAIKELGNGFSFMALSNAKQALLALKSSELKPDYIFLDLNMPGMTAEDFLFSLEGCEQLHTIPVIIYTGSVTLANISPGWPGVKHSFKKPNSYRELINSLALILNES